MAVEKAFSRLSVQQFACLSMLLQLLPVFIFFLIFGFTTCISYGNQGICGNDGGAVFFASFPIINYAIFFAVIIVSSIQATTNSELLASSMNVVWILFIWKETEHMFDLAPYQYLIFLFCISLTLPIRIVAQKQFQKTR